VFGVLLAERLGVGVTETVTVAVAPHIDVTVYTVETEGVTTTTEEVAPPGDQV
jgi:hypothetical protein